MIERHHSLEGFGHAGQQALADASVLVVGLGGLGSPVARYLAAAGIGRLTLCDFDHVSASDLHRQILYGDGDVGASKVALAAARLVAAHRGVDVVAVDRPFEAGDVAGHDVVVDCTDEPGTRALVHAACQDADVPLVWGTVEGWDGQVTTIMPGGPCIDCLFPEGREAPSCSEIGVFGPLAGLVGTAMATEACKVIAGLPVLQGRLWVIDGRESRIDDIAYPVRPDCSCSAATK